jgi:ribosome-associated protein
MNEKTNYAEQTRFPSMERTLHITDRFSIPLTELRFAFARSGGPGGQNVNKVSTRVDVIFNFRESPSLSAVQKLLVENALGARLDREGNLRVTAQDSRSQWKNREAGTGRLADLLRRALTPRRRRIPTKATASSRAEKSRTKKAHSRKKQARGTRPDMED